MRHAVLGERKSKSLQGYTASMFATIYKILAQLSSINNMPQQELLHNDSISTSINVGTRVAENFTTKAPFFSPQKFLEIAVLGFVFIIASLLGLRQIHSPDLGFHIQIGNWILDNARFPDQEVFMYTVAGNQYIDLSWLYQVLQALLERIGGFPAIILFNDILILIALFVTTIRTAGRSSAQMIFLPLLLLLGLNVLSFETRPQVISWVYLSLILLVLERYIRNEKTPLWSVPIIMMIWANSHPVAILGLVVIFVFPLGEYLKHRHIDKKLVRISLLSVASYLVTPYFLNGLTIPYQQFGFLQSGNIFKYAFGELISPFTLSVYRNDGVPFFLQSAFPLHLFAVIAVFIAIVCFRRRAWTDLILIVVSLYIFSLAIRNFGFFFLMASPIIVQYLQKYRSAKASQAKKERKKQPERVLVPLVKNIRSRRILSYVTILLAAIMLDSIFTGAWNVFWKSDLQLGLALNPLHVPYRAISFLNDKNLKGKIINDVSSGGWLIKLWKGQVFIDGRFEVYGDQFFRKILETYRNPKTLEAITAEYGPQIALFDYMKTPQWLSFFIGRKDWRLTYADDHSVVWLKNGYADEIPAITVPAGYDTLGKTPPMLDIINKDYPTGFTAFYNALTRSQYYPWSEYQESILASQLGWYNAAEHLALTGLNKSTVPNTTLLFNLAYFLSRRGNIEGARAAYLRILDYKNDAEARRRLIALPRY